MQVRSLGQEDPLQDPQIFFPGESHGQRSLVGYSSQGHKESDMTEATQQACTQITAPTLRNQPSIYLIVELKYTCKVVSESLHVSEWGPTLSNTVQFLCTVPFAFSLKESTHSQSSLAYSSSHPPSVRLLHISVIHQIFFVTLYISFWDSSTSQMTFKIYIH